MNRNLQKIRQKCDSIHLLCAGFATPFSAFYDEPQNYGILTEQLLKYTANRIHLDEQPLYRHFYNFSLAYIGAACPPSDQILLSIAKLGAQVLYTDGPELSTFEIMLNASSSYNFTDVETELFEQCKKHYMSFCELASKFYNQRNFKCNVDYALRRLISDNNLSLLNDSASFNSIDHLLDFVSHSIRQEAKRQNKL